jgi:prepilin-type N-terminal cleavage/methylation domain-containing protein
MNRTAETTSPTGKSSLRHSSGFTLIEILVTVVILATGIVLVLRAFETSLVALGESRDALRASELIKAKMTELNLQARVEGKIDTSPSGSFDDPYRDYRWEIATEAAESAAAENGGGDVLTKLNVTVWREGSRTTYSADTFIRVSGTP